MAETSREQQLQEILIAYLEAVESGQFSSPEDWFGRYPEFAGELAEFFAGRKKLEQLAPPVPQAAMDAPTMEPAAQARDAASLARASGVEMQLGVGSKLRYFG